MTPDRRITPFRLDLAADFLEGKVTAARFVPGVTRRVIRGCVALHRAPAGDAARDTELLFGEVFTVYDDQDGWCWGQAKGDGYVGYLRSADLGSLASATHKIIAPLTPLLPSPDVKGFARDMLPMGAAVTVLDHAGGYARLPEGFVHAAHLAPLAAHAPDWVRVAQSFIGTPYLWGGKSWGGMDCSGLMQVALMAAGIQCPRDTDMQEAFFPDAPAARSRGDMMFWKGHVGVMLDNMRLLHANAYHMAVAVEPLEEAVPRIVKTSGPPTSVKRPR